MECKVCHKTLLYKTKSNLCRKHYIESSPYFGESREKNFNWKGGRFINDAGYIMIRQPEHPFANNIGYVREHRLIMEQHIGRYLKREEIIHHRNEVKTDNRIENLEIINKSDHARKHNTKNRKCIFCNNKHRARGYCMKHYYIYFQKYHMKKG